MSDPNDDPEAASDLDAEGLVAIRQAMAGLQKTSPPEPEARRGRFTPKFLDLESWVAGYFALTFGRQGEDHLFWCDHWWDHPEAVLRLEAMWRTWEVAAQDPVRGLPTWIRQHLDPNLAVLFSDRGPFAGCRDGQHTKNAVLPVSPPPPGWDTEAQGWWDVLGEEDV